MSELKFMSIKDLEAIPDNRKTYISGEKGIILQEGDKLLVKGDSSNLFRLIAALADRSKTYFKSYYGMNVDFDGKIVYRDLFHTHGALVPHIKEELEKIGTPHIAKEIYIHENDICLSSSSTDESNAVYGDNTIIVLDFGNVRYSPSHREIYDIVNKLARRGHTVIFTPPKYKNAPEGSEEVLESTATTIIYPDSVEKDKSWFVGRYFPSFYVTKSK